SCSNAKKIQEQGLFQNSNVTGPKWYTLASDLPSAVFHAPEPPDSCIVVFEVPSGARKRWPGWPYLWPGYHHTWNDSPSVWYAIRQGLPASFVVDVRRISTKLYEEHRQ